MLVLEDLHKRYGETRALDGLSMTVQPGRVTGFLGPNGAGKTTAMRCILGLTSADRGTITFAGRPLTHQDRRTFAYMPEERGLYEDMRVLDMVVLLARLHGLDKTAAVDRATTLLTSLGLGDRLADKVKDLSLGNQQRVQLAGALAHEPGALVLDEPFSGLDPVGVDAIAELIAAEAAKGKVVLFSSHQLDLVEDLCEAVAIVDGGRIVAAGPVNELAVAGSARLVVAVEGDHRGRWVEPLDGVTVSERTDGGVRLVLEPHVDAQQVLAAARAAGPVLHFARERRRLSEVFREAVARRQEAAAP